MQKIPTMFVRDEANPRHVTNQITPGCEWVTAGEGVATRKYDGTCCRILNGTLWRRYEVGFGKPIPAAFEQEATRHDKNGKTVLLGWVPVGDGPEDKWHRDAWARGGSELTDGTYELVGPKVQGNPEKFDTHRLVSHAAAAVLDGAPRDFDGLHAFLYGRDIEGIVFHHPDGRMAKIKLRDLGLKRAA